MQLPSSTAPADPTLAAFFPLGGATPSAAGAPAAEGAGAFAQLFPDLAPTTPATGKNPAALADPVLAGIFSTVAATGSSGPVPTPCPMPSASLDHDFFPATVPTGAPASDDSAASALTTASATPSALVVSGLPASAANAGPSTLGGMPTPQPGKTRFSSGPQPAISGSDAALAATPGSTPVAGGVPTAGGQPCRAGDGAARRPVLSAANSATSSAGAPTADVAAVANAQLPVPPANTGVPPPPSDTDGASTTAAAVGPTVFARGTRPSTTIAARGARPDSSGPSKNSGRASAAVAASAANSGSNALADAGVAAVGSLPTLPIDDRTASTGTAADGSPVAGVCAHPIFAGEMSARYLAPTAPVALSAPPAAAANGQGDGTPVASASSTAAHEELSAVADAAAQLVPPVRSESATPTAGAFPEIALSSASQMSTADHPETGLGGRGEKFAAAVGKFAAGKTSPTFSSDKTFLSTLDKRVASTDAGLGIDVAKPSGAMPAATFFDHPATTAVLAHASVSAVAAAPVESPLPTAALSAGDSAGAAHRAVEAVLTAADRFSTGDRHAVNLQFSVGGADLTVRVELRADEVRTVFHTDSPELRAALNHEWQAVNAGTSSDRSVRLASPVFSTSDASHLSSFSGDSAPRQRDAGGGRAAAEEIFSTVGSRSRVAPIGSAATSPAAALPPAFASAGTALHLHTLA